MKTLREKEKSLVTHVLTKYTEPSLVRGRRTAIFLYQLFEVRTIKVYENIEKKGEIARNMQFLLFS